MCSLIFYVLNRILFGLKNDLNFEKLVSTSTVTRGQNSRFIQMSGRLIEVNDLRSGFFLRESDNLFANVVPLIKDLASSKIESCFASEIPCISREVIMLANGVNLRSSNKSFSSLDPAIIFLRQSNASDLESGLYVKMNCLTLV